ncbi:MAG: sigma 54-interacting transcriptional regulator [Lachnospiraceae bacterium]|nr:sigma 54-interacting transcriptional regulator [Lachnospiraceae bacterium]
MYGAIADTVMHIPYRELFSLLSFCGIGAAAAGPDGKILAVNEEGCRMLKQESEHQLIGRDLAEAVPGPEESGTEQEAPLFDTYLERISGTLHPAGLPEGASVELFRCVTDSIHFYMAERVLNLLPEAVSVWDDKGRMVIINDTAVKREGHTLQDAKGRTIEELFEARNNTYLAMPKVLKTREPILNLRQDYTTENGRELQIVSQNYPILKDGRLLGAVSIMEDYTEMDELNRRVIELQQRLKEKSGFAPSKIRNMLAAKYTFKDILYGSEVMQKTVFRCRQAAKTDSPVMLYGETGCGKELFAQSIHNAGARASGPFLAVNCAAIPTTLLESILFGTEKGAYTGAVQREGLLEQAGTGTLLLDEINSMDIQLQSKLLRVLQDGYFRRVGGSKQIFADVRVITNINISPLEAVERGLLREDLYYRLGVVEISIPALRDRREDIPLLVRSFLSELCPKLKKNVNAVSPEVMEIFDRHRWPGNVRELRHTVEYALNIIPPDQDILIPEDLPEKILRSVQAEKPVGAEDGNKTTGIQTGGSLPADDADLRSFDEVITAAGQQYLLRILRRNGGNLSRTAREMGISRQNLQHKMKRYGVQEIFAGPENVK